MTFKDSLVQGYDLESCYLTGNLVLLRDFMPEFSLENTKLRICHVAYRYAAKLAKMMLIIYTTCTIHACNIVLYLHSLLDSLGYLFI